MAWITKKHKKKEREYYNNVSAQYYASKQWRILRDNYIIHHPLCERCLKEDRITPAQHVHHIRPFLTGQEAKDRWNLLLDAHNLMSVCPNCHRLLHSELHE